MERSKLILLTLLLSACTTTTIPVRQEPFNVIVGSEALEACKNQSTLKYNATFQDVLEAKVDDSTNYKACESSRLHLQEVLEELEHEQIIRFTTPRSKGSGPSIKAPSRTGVGIKHSFYPNFKN